MMGFEFLVVDGVDSPAPRNPFIYVYSCVFANSFHARVPGDYIPPNIISYIYCRTHTRGCLRPEEAALVTFSNCFLPSKSFSLV